MKVTKIKISNLFGIKEQELDGRSVELTGGNGVGKTSVLDAIAYALTNQAERDYVIKKGEKEGEIIIETDTGLRIDRRKRTAQADYKSIKDGGKDVPGAETFLRTLFTPLQLNPVEFTQLSKKEQNRIILDLIHFDWDLNWIREQFGEIPTGVNYEQNILQVLNDIQAENGDYFQNRQDVNRDIRNKMAFIEDIAKDIPAGYNAEKWSSYDLGSVYKQIAKIKADNNVIERAKAFLQNIDNKKRGFEAERDISLTALEKEISEEKTNLLANIERLKAEITSAQDKLNSLGEKYNDKAELIKSRYNENVAKLQGDMATAEEYSSREIVDCSGLEAEVNTAEEMRKHLNEYNRMKTMQDELEDLKAESEEYTRKIELARNLPAKILETADIPIKGFSVEDGIPLINGLPISNLSEGEQLDLCIDVALSKPNALQIILIDGAEKLSEVNRERLYRKCKEKDLQFIATRTTNANELEVTYL